GLQLEPDNATPTTAVRVCKEEAQWSPIGSIYVSGRTKNAAGPPPYGRLDFPPLDSSYATQNAGKPIQCNTATGLSLAADCGCGVGLERCMPGAGVGFDNPAFVFPTRLPLGEDAPF